MGTNHGDFSGNTQVFSGVRQGEAANAMELTNQFTRMMKQMAAEVAPQWPETMNAPVMRQPFQSPSLDVQFNVVLNGQTYGPYDMNALSQMAAQGYISAQSMVWRQGMTGWQAAGTVPELAGLFAKAESSNIPSSPPMVS